MFSAQQLEAVQKRVAEACRRVGRSPDEITIIGVTKTVSSSDIRAAYHAGLEAFGENRVQEAAPKITSLQQLGVSAQWHLVGHLQSNKAKKALELFDVIQSVDTPRLAETLQRHADQHDRVVEVFAQVNTTGEPTKFGVEPSGAVDLVRHIAAQPNLRLTGLMTIAGYGVDSAIVRRSFRTLRELAEEISALELAGVEMRHLSMGMTDDFEVAIEEGSTMVRIGRAIFGERP